MPDNTYKPLSLGRRWGAYRPTKGVWFWSSLGCIVATIVVGFVWGGWVTGGTATVAQLAELKKASSYQRGDMLVKSGWLTLPGSAEPVVGAANICAEKLTSADLKTAING
jgi:hypothetical protein